MEKDQDLKLLLNEVFKERGIDFSQYRENLIERRVAATILILIAEYLKENLDKPQIYVYGTDIDKWSIEKAKDGVYEEFEFKDMPKDLKEKYFLEVGNKKFWRRKEWNKFLFFKIHDIAKDDPPKSFDMVLCRNLFIYFKRELQEACLEKFSKALNKNGFLVLGLTESLWGAMAKSFVEFDRENRIYRKI